MTPDLFSAVNQFDSMRQSIQRPPASIQSPEMGAIPFGGTMAGGMPAIRSTGQMVQGGSGKGLVDFMGRKIAAGLLPRAQYIANQFGLRLTSGYRDPDHNRRVGGVDNSFHLREGESGGLDWVGSAKAMQDAELWARQNGAKEALRHAVKGGGFHLHVAW